MSKTIQELFATEKGSPLRIRRWLRLQGHNARLIDIAIAEHAQHIIDGGNYGYKGEMSLLSQSIRDRVKELTLYNEQDISQELNKLKIKKTVPWYMKKLW